MAGSALSGSYGTDFESDSDITAPRAGVAARAWGRFMTFLAEYHSWEVVGAEHVPRHGGAIATCTHSLASYDLFIMVYGASEILGRPAYIVGDDLMFRVPGLRRTLDEIGFIPGGREHVVERLRRGDLLGIAPGGMKESLRSSRQRHKFDWSSRRGFVWAALSAGVPIIPAVCPNSDYIYTVYGNPITDRIYRSLKVPLPVFRGIGPTLLPRPVKLTTYVGEPIVPDVAPDRFAESDVERIHRQVIEATERLMEEARLRGARPTGVELRSIRKR